jgi:hypothetical protein
MTTYRVKADDGFDGHAKGDEFEDELDPAIEAWAIDRGAIEIAKGSAKKKEDTNDA